MLEQSLRSGDELLARLQNTLRGLPDGEKFMSCIQCGTCGGSCPSAADMEYTPRELIALLRAGFVEKALKANTIWYCTSCYLCTVRCPMEIRITDLMYALKDFAHREHLHDESFNAPRLAETFVDVVNSHGRNAEMEFLTRYYLRVNPLAMLRMAPLGMKLLATGRMPLAAKSIRGIDEIQAIIEKVKSMGGGTR